ncbi:MAG TPA: OmpH family outer membrane protein, partial [Tepidisphaeraceae bacterium]|nr:OmpH family outer membrane protein [Tepidisphaeraceae bacterium]
ILKKQNEGNFQLQLAKAMLNGLQKQAVNALYAKVRTTVESVAKEEGYTLVINNLIPQITEQAVNEMNINQFLSFILQSSTIMYSDPSINITEKVLTKLDAEYSDTAPATPAEGD